MFFSGLKTTSYSASLLLLVWCEIPKGLATLAVSGLEFYIISSDTTIVRGTADLSESLNLVS